MLAVPVVQENPGPGMVGLHPGRVVHGGDWVHGHSRGHGRGHTARVAIDVVDVDVAVDVAVAVDVDVGDMQ